MYIPSSFAEEDVSTLYAFVEAHPLATLVTAVDGSGLFATHLPLLLDRTVEPRGRLFGHIARANPHARQLASGSSDALVIFTGPEAYITPAWYATKAASGRVVPTWNYVAVHAYGKVTLRGEPEFLRPHLEALTRQHEVSRAGTWEVSDAPDDYIAQQMRAIVGVEITIERLEGKWKMSQNRSGEDIDGVVNGLSASSALEDHVVAGIVAARAPRRATPKHPG
jgi:transcriptional regulator